MNLDTHVYCTHCKHLKYNYFGTPNVTPICVHENECDIWDAEDSKSFSKRPYYEDRAICDYHKVLKDDAKIFSDIAEISVEESTKILQEVMKTYELTDEEASQVIDKLNEIH